VHCARLLTHDCLLDSCGIRSVLRVVHVARVAPGMRGIHAASIAPATNKAPGGPGASCHDGYKRLKSNGRT
jgi:hypothetical protein